MPVATAKDLQAKAQQALADSKVYALRELVIDRDDDTLVIVGEATSFYHKQLAQEIVRHAAPGVEVVNAVHVL
ncbi:MAG: BON domain-containing protein [Planctomycetota bacterium]|nr:MAG: BON domain-containing protein [Planctomycetota bacterium]